MTGLWALVGAVDRLGRHALGAAVDNGRSSAAAIVEQVRLRQALTPAQDDDGPGALVRLGRAICLELLASRRTGRLTYVARAGVPDVVPVNLALDVRRLLVRSGPGPKLQAAERREVVAVEVDDIDEDTRTGWSVVALDAGELDRDDRRARAACPRVGEQVGGQLRGLAGVEATGPAGDRRLA